jgi:hypothetical protein
MHRRRAVMLALGSQRTDDALAAAVARQKRVWPAEPDPRAFVMVSIPQDGKAPGPGNSRESDSPSDLNSGQPRTVDKPG